MNISPMFCLNIGKGGKKSSGGGKAAAAVSATGTLLKDFRVELAKSSGAACRICEVKIKKGEARIGKKDFESQRAKMYGPYDRWHHVACFASKRDELEYFDAGDKLQGFNALGPDDKDTIRQALKEVKSKRKAAAAAGNPDEPDSKKPKMDDKMKADLKKQMTKIYYYRDLMERHMSKKQLEHLLTLNDQEIPVGIDRMLDRISDCMMFGALEKCDECKDGQLVFRSGVGYECLGQMSEWTKCQVRTLSPKRKEFKLPEEFRNEFDFCKLYKWKKGLSRIVPNSVLANPPAAASATATSKTIKEKSLPLRNLCFVLDGKIDKSLLKDKIQTMGGSVRSKVDQETAAVISTLGRFTGCFLTNYKVISFNIDSISTPVYVNMNHHQYHSEANRSKKTFVLKDPANSLQWPKKPRIATEPHYSRFLAENSAVRRNPSFRSFARLDSFRYY